MKILSGLKTVWNKIPKGIQFTLKTYILGLIYFQIFRLILLIVGTKELSGSNFSEVFGAFLVGIRFDTVAIGYILILPVIMIIIQEIIPIKAVLYKKLTFIITSILFCVGFLVSAVDIPYYLYFNARITESVFNWFSTAGMVFKFIAESPEYYIYALLLIAICYLFIHRLRKFYKTWVRKDNQEDKRSQLWRLKYALIYLLMAVLMFAGIRGKIFSRRPISWAEAFISVHQFPNYLGLNSLYMLVSSMFDKEKNSYLNLKLMDNDKALKIVQQELGISSEINKDYPLLRYVKYDGEPHKYNVVVFIVESFAYAYIGDSHLFHPSLTPFIDSLITKSYFFTNMYADGIHTYNGVWAVLTSLPSAPTDDNLMKNISNVQSFSGIANTLRSFGYNTFFSCPHDVNFDNMGGMLRAGGYNYIRTQSEYLNKDFVNVWGISDHIQFRESFPKLREIAQQGNPFLATFLTVSNHGPYNLPNPLPADFKPHYTDKKLRAVEYTDWSLKYFMQMAQKEPWFNNTIFVFIADHGQNVVPSYEMNYFHKHIPMIVYAPGIIKEGTRIPALGNQVDLFPTVMHLLNLSYYNNTMGVDLLKAGRRYSFFNANTLLGAASDSLFAIKRSASATPLLYKFRNVDKTNYYNQYPEEANRMAEYSSAFYQTGMWIIKNKKSKYILHNE